MSELGPEAREILRNGRDGDNPSSADRARIHAALMATIAAGAVTTAANSANAAADLSLPASVGTAKPILSSLVGSLFAKGMLIVFVGAAGAGAYWAWPSDKATPAIVTPQMSDKPAESKNAELSEKQAAIEVAPEKPEESTPVSSAMVVPAKPNAVHVAGSALPNKPVEESADSIIAETQRLREAHGALREGDPNKALELLSERAAEDEGQKLREERAAARVLALCKLGRVDEAHAEAAAFLAQNPRSPMADRVRKACPKGP